MNGENQGQQEQHRPSERVAHLETALDYQNASLLGLREEMRTGFARMDAEFVRVHAQLTKIRTTDFRILLSIFLTTALGNLGLLFKVYGML
jgi:hypothetical protein